MSFPSHTRHCYIRPLVLRPLFSSSSAPSQTRKLLLFILIFAPLPFAQVLSAFQGQQSAAPVQPQLLIPLSSIPSYSAAMDTNALLGGMYKKFPYPSMAEITSLAAQTQFTEEQIKVDGSGVMFLENNNVSENTYRSLNMLR